MQDRARADDNCHVCLNKPFDMHSFISDLRTFALLQHRIFESTI